MSALTPSASPAAARLARFAGSVLAAGGLANLIFLVTAGGAITGADVMTSTRWAVAHQAHFYAALLLLLGLPALFARLAPRAGTFGTVAVLAALIGTGFFFASGVITAFLLPVVARHAPDVVSATGPMFHPPLPIIGIGIVAFAIGWCLLGVAAWRAAWLPRWAAAALAAGAVLQGLPPTPIGPFPWLVLDLGGAVMAAALVAAGRELWRHAADRTRTPAPLGAVVA